MINTNVYETPLGLIEITEDGQGITGLLLIKERDKDIVLNETPLLKAAICELREYLSGERREFTIPLNPKGTEFQQKVWSELKKVPYGETRSYKEIAIAIGNPKAARAIGMANNKNPIMIIIPCHRIIGASGKLVGYAGGMEMKVQLLDLEGRGEFVDGNGY